MSDILVGPQTGSGFVITRIWLAVVVHDDGDESVPAVEMPNGAWVPLMAADERRLSWVRERAQAMAEASGKPIKVVRFDTRTDLETFGGGR